MPGEDPQSLSGLSVPQPRGLVLRPGEDAPPVRGEGDGGDPVFMPGEDLQSLSGLCVPKPRGVVYRPGDDAPPVR